MNLPKIVFKEMSLKDNIDLVKWSFFESDDTLDLHAYTIKCYSELASIDLSLPKEKIYQRIEEVVTNYYNSNIDLIKKEASRYNDTWSKYNDYYFIALTKYLNISWPEDRKIITADVGILPVCPRYLDDFSFSLSVGEPEKGIIEICAHESLHFLWFEKWKNMYPETPREEFDSPYLPWKYSEMVTDPILNSKDINKVINVLEKGYDSFYELYDGDEKVMDKLRSIYSTNSSIEEKIKTGYDYIREYEEKKNKCK